MLDADDRRVEPPRRRLRHVIERAVDARLVQARAIGAEQRLQRIDALDLGKIAGKAADLIAGQAVGRLGDRLERLVPRRRLSLPSTRT